MVSLAPLGHSVDAQALQRSIRGAIDLSARKVLSRTEDTEETLRDAFGEAALLWTLVRHADHAVNLGTLGGRARVFCRSVLVDGAVGRQRDTTTAAALWCAASLKLGKAISPAEVAELQDGGRALVGCELAPGRVPFDRPAFGAAIALGCDVLEIDLPGGESTLAALVDRYLDGKRAIRPLGAGILATVLARRRAHNWLRDLLVHAEQVAEDASLDYEERVYWTHAAWICAEALGEHDLVQLAPIVEATLRNVPVLEAIETGLGQIAQAGPEGEVVQVSALYLAALHDLASGYARWQERLQSRRIEARFQGNSAHRGFTFLGVAGPPVAVAAIVAWQQRYSALVVFQVFFLLRTDVAAWDEALWAAARVVGTCYLLTAALSVGVAAFQSVVLRNTASDLQLRRLICRTILHHVVALTKWLLAAVVLGIAINMASEAIKLYSTLERSTGSVG